MLKRICLVALTCVVPATPALAQEPRVEISALVGWALSEGVDGNPVATADGNIYDRVDPKDSFGWGLMGGFLVSEEGEVGFMFRQQLTTLEASGTNTTDIGDMTVNYYHGYFSYNFLPGARVRPYVLGGLGASNYSSVDYTRLNGLTGTIGGVTRFSSTWGAGLKVGGSPNVGARLGVLWTPTYIKSDAVGWWCDPFWGCYLVGDAQYSRQFEFSGGITFRF